MSIWFLGLGVILLLYALALAMLVVVGRKEDARTWARLVPDCLIFIKRLLLDRRVKAGYKLVLLALIGYLAMPFDVVPDFIPVVGLLDDVILVFLVLRIVLRGVPAAVVTERWPGSTESLGRVVSITGEPRTYLRNMFS